jgi:hypothetical protein
LERVAAITLGLRLFLYSLDRTASAFIRCKQYQCKRVDTWVRVRERILHGARLKTHVLWLIVYASD